MFTILETKSDDSLRLIFLMKTKDTNLWHFVNPVKGHICPHSFETPTDAFNDLSTRVDNGKLKRFKIAKGWIPTIDAFNNHVFIQKLKTIKIDIQERS